MQREPFVQYCTSERYFVLSAETYYCYEMLCQFSQSCATSISALFEVFVFRTTGGRGCRATGRLTLDQRYWNRFQ